MTVVCEMPQQGPMARRPGLAALSEVRARREECSFFRGGYGVSLRGAAVGRLASTQSRQSLAGKPVAAGKNPFRNMEKAFEVRQGRAAGMKPFRSRFLPFQEIRA